MTLDSIRKDVTRAMLVTLFRVIGFALGAIIVIFVFGFLFGSGGKPAPQTTLEVLPNHEWKINEFSKTAPTILQIDLRGVIGLSRHLRRQEVRKILVESLDGDLKPGQVKGILLYIDSPGGTVDDADGIYQLIKEYKAKTKVNVIAFVDGLCASGGMYIACSADKIIATKVSMVGSIGVIMPTAFNVSSLLTRLGVESTTIFAGVGKDDLNPFRPWKEDEEAPYQNLINNAYDQFITLVSAARPLLTKPVLQEIGAQVFPTDQALTKGYIDEINDSYFAVLEAYSGTLGIQSTYQVVQLKIESLLQELFTDETGATKGALKGTINHQLRLPGDIEPELVGKALYLYRPNTTR